MGFVRQDQPDVFISYAQYDDEPVPGWVSGFVDGLESSLKMELGPVDGKQLHVFRDFQLPTGARIGADLQQKVENSATLLLILSKSYLKSVWTPIELKWFVQHINVRNGATVRARIFPIEFTNVQRPEELGDVLCRAFWFEEPVKKRPRTLGYPKPSRDNPADRDFYNLLRDLGEDIAVELTRQKSLPPAPIGGGGGALDAIPPAAAPTGPVVYLAPVTADLQQQRERVRRYLELEGFQVAPSRAYVDDAKFIEQVDADLGLAMMFVQLLSADPGAALPGSPDPRVATLAARATSQGKPMLLWRSAKETLPAGLPHLPLLLRASTVDLEVFQQGVVDRIKKLQQGERQKTTAPPGYDCTVLVNCSEDVRPQVNQIRQELDQRHAYAVLPPNLETAQPNTVKVSQNRQTLEANLLDCDGLLLVAHEVGAWIQSQLLQTGKALARRERPLPVFQWTQPGNPHGPEFDAFLNGLRGRGPGI
ncbi:MAG TPA: TIR domain-containing protein [Gemmataceae bacterium]|jgi:hypothetical protein|nr:TIR domain-containing protein [Gemmataceae bacterium]